jgi:hypothetical protein
MKKQTRIALVLGIALILSLALTIPGLADDPVTYGDCQIQFPTYNPGSSSTTWGAPGEYTVMEWEDGTLINVCEGNVPFEEPVHGKGKLIYFSYDALATLDSFVVYPEYTYVDDETYTGSLTANVYDTDGTVYPVTDWYAKFYPNGAYEFYREYTP